jgi:hypothetical protein
MFLARGKSMDLASSQLREPGTDNGSAMKGVGRIVTRIASRVNGKLKRPRIAAV